MININCYCIGTIFYYCFESLPNHISEYKEYKLSYENDEVIVEIQNKNVRIKITHEEGSDIHVCLAGNSSHYPSSFCKEIKSRASFYQTKFPEVAILIAGNFTEKNTDLDIMKDVEINGVKMHDQNMYDTLARSVGAIKYVEFAWKSGRGAKILIDEIACAGIIKLKQLEKETKRKLTKKAKKESCFNAKSEEAQKLHKRDIPLIYFSVLFLIISIIICFAGTALFLS